MFSFCLLGLLLESRTMYNILDKFGLELKLTEFPFDKLVKTLSGNLSKSLVICKFGIFDRFKSLSQQGHPHEGEVMHMCNYVWILQL